MQSARMSTDSSSPRSNLNAMNSNHPLAHDISWMLGRVWLGFGEVRTHALEPFGLSVRDYVVLKAIQAEGGSQIDLANLTKIDKSTFAVTADGLESRGLIERRPNPGDRRSKLLTLSRVGDEVLAHASHAVTAADNTVWESVEHVDIERFSAVLQALSLDTFESFPAFSVRRFHG